MISRITIRITKIISKISWPLKVTSKLSKKRSSKLRMTKIIKQLLTSNKLMKLIR